jgi:hypothetical protein
VTDEHSYSQPTRCVPPTSRSDLGRRLREEDLVRHGRPTRWNGLDPKATQLCSTRANLTIAKSEGWAPTASGRRWSSRWRRRDKVLGTKLTIETPDRPKQVRITYATSPNASGLQWLSRR